MAGSHSLTDREFRICDALATQLGLCDTIRGGACEEIIELLTLTSQLANNVVCWEQLNSSTKRRLMEIQLARVNGLDPDAVEVVERLLDDDSCLVSDEVDLEGYMIPS